MKFAILAATFLITISAASPDRAAADALDTALASCWSCHGSNAAPKDPTIPIIQGQHAQYVEKQLRDFVSGERDSQIMSSMAESVPPKDLARAATLIAAMPWPKIAASKVPAPETIAVCAACHGAEFNGGASPEGFAPKLAGQFAEYLGDQMNAFARGERSKAKTMTAMMKSLKAEERTQLAKYLAGL
jgi:cytochrome c553